MKPFSDQLSEPGWFTEDDAEAKADPKIRAAIWTGIAKRMGGEVAYWVGSALGWTSHARPDLFRERLALAVDYAKRAAHAAHQARPDLRDEEGREPNAERLRAAWDAAISGPVRARDFYSEED